MVRAKDPGKGLYGLPGGFVDVGETAEQALDREVLEEIGLQVRSRQYLASFPNEYAWQGFILPVTDLFFVVEVESFEGMQKIQKIVTTVQKQIYRLQGSVNKLVMDDKGSTFICLWGVCPLSHEDDASRAILTGFNIIKSV